MNLTQDEVVTILKKAYMRGMREHALQKVGSNLNVDVKNIPDFVIEDIIPQE